MGPAKRWLPLESNPEVMNSFVEKLGADTSSWAFCDVFGLDPELLMMVPQPVLAVLMVFPITDQSEKAKDEGAGLSIFCDLSERLPSGRLTGSPLAICCSPDSSSFQFSSLDPYILLLHAAMVVSISSVKLCGLYAPMLFECAKTQELACGN
mmetsp:Transcript_5513/g.15363  ORF Transcript_5513/g.15363 Transcript_5513/m.15363 type:complete len:152 (+) Transcript_5513:123-578(+)